MHVSLSNAALYCNCPAKHLSTENHGISSGRVVLDDCRVGHPTPAAGDCRSSSALDFPTLKSAFALHPEIEFANKFGRTVSAIGTRSTRSGAINCTTPLRWINRCGYRRPFVSACISVGSAGEVLAVGDNLAPFVDSRQAMGGVLIV